MKKIKNTRTIIQIIFLVMVIIAALNHYLQSIGQAVPWISESIFHYFCPTCGVISIYQFLISSTFWIEKLRSIMGITIGFVIVLTIILGPVICSYICPFGTIQDLAARIGKKIFKKKYNRFLPEKLDDKLKYLRYVSLAVTVILTALSGVAIIEAINPYHTFLAFFNGKQIGIVGLAILTLVVIASLFVQRPWCKYLCPYGAFLGLFNKVKIFRVLRQQHTCIGCKRCDKECAMGIEIQSMGSVRDVRCTSCMDCVDEGICPKSGTLVVTSKDTEREEKENN